jgi:hypothetical protein
VTDPIVAPARSLLAYSRHTGAALELVPSARTPGLFHLVDPVRRECSCNGWEFRKNCRHLSPLAPARPLAEVEPVAAIPECGICSQPHPCHSPHLKAYCDVCVPPAPRQSQYAQDLGESAPAPVRVPLVGRMSA